MTLNREGLLAAAKCPTETVELPEGTVRLRGMTGRDLIAFQKSMGDKDEDSFAARLLVRCIIDADGSRVFADDDWPALLDWSGAVIQRLATVALRLCGYGTDAGNS